MTSTNAPRLFPATHWSVLLAARSGDEANSMRALETLCQAYWYPLYAYLRKQGHSPHDAQDLTQGFFARLLEKHYLDAADRDKGRFRSFLLMALKRFLAKEWERDHAQKRGGGQATLSLNTELAERR
jgi:RNA polymerase sigma-70 factor (ECF subfamily)